MGRTPTVPSPGGGLLALKGLSKSKGILSRALTKNLTSDHCFRRMIVSSSTVARRLARKRVLPRPMISDLTRMLKMSVVLSMSEVRLLANGGRVCCPNLVIPFTTFSLGVHPILHTCVPSQMVPIIAVDGISDLL